MVTRGKQVLEIPVLVMLVLRLIAVGCITRCVGCMGLGWTKLLDHSRESISMYNNALDAL